MPVTGDLKVTEQMAVGYAFHVPYTEREILMRGVGGECSVC